MPITIRFDRAKPMASVEFMIQGALPHYEVAKAQAEDRTEVQPLLTAPGFKRLGDAPIPATHFAPPTPYHAATRPCKFLSDL